MPVHVSVQSDLIQMQVNDAEQADTIQASALLHPHACHTWLLQPKLDTVAIAVYSTISPRRIHSYMHFNYSVAGTHTVLYCVVLYCIALYSIPFYPILFYCTVLYCIVWYGVVLYCIELSGPAVVV